MEREKMIEEMREIAEVLSAGWCRKGKCTGNKCVVDDCDIMAQAREIYEAGYRKIPDGAVVLTREEYNKLHSYISEERAREIFDEETKKLKDAIRKETAKEIFGDIFSDKYSIGGGLYELTQKDKKILYKEFNVEVEE